MQLYGQCLVDHKPDMSQWCHCMLSFSLLSVWFVKTVSCVRKPLKKTICCILFLLIYEHLLKYWLWMANPVAVTALLLTWGSFVHPCTYDEYFGKKICTVGSKVLEEIDLARGYTQLPMRVSYPINPCAYCLKFLKRSPGCATGFPDTGQTITVRAVTSLLCWSSLSFINLHRSQFMKNS